MNLKAKRAKSYYKSEELWLKAVYRNNKEVIDNAFGKIKTVNPTSNFYKFKTAISGYEKYGQKKTKYSALKTLSKSELFIPEKQRLKENAVKAIKGHEKWKDFRALSRDKKGRFEKLDYSKLTYQGNKTYFYESESGIIVIKFTNSPETVDVMTYEEYMIK